MKIRIFSKNLTATSRAHLIFIGTIAVLIAGQSARATDLFWDTNDITDGSGAVAGTWGTSNFWNTDPLGGAAGAFQALTAIGDNVFFSAGTNGGSGTVTVAAATAQLANSITFDDPVAITVSPGASATITLGSTTGAGVFRTANAAATISTPITLGVSGVPAAYSFSNSGTAALTISGAITGSGTSSATTQTITVGSSSSGGITFSAGILDAPLVSPGPPPIPGGKVALNVNNTSTGATTFSSSASTFSGGITLTAGTIIVANSAAASGAVITNGPLGTTTLTINGGVISNNGTSGRNLQFTQINVGADFQIGSPVSSPSISSIGRLRIGATWELGGATRTVTLYGGVNTALTNGSEQLGFNGLNATLPVSSVQNGRLSFVAGAGAGAANPATVRVSALTNYTNNSGLSIGTNVIYRLGTASATATNAPTVTLEGTYYTAPGELGGSSQSAAVYSLTGSSTGLVTNPATNPGTSTFTISGASGSTTFAGKLTNGLDQPITGISPNGILALTKSGDSTQVLSGANTYSGTTTISGGTLTMGSASALGSQGLSKVTGTGGTTISAGGTLDLNGQTGVNEVLTLNGSGVGDNGALINSSGTAASIAGGAVSSLSVTGTPSGLSGTTTLNITGGGGSGATAVASMGITAASFAITPSTATYSTAPTVTIADGGGIGATATAILSGGATGTLTGITITNIGNGYTTAPTISFGTGTVLVAGDPASGVGNATNFTLAGVRLTANGSGYTSAPAVSLSTGSAAITANLSSVAMGASGSYIGGTGDITINPPVSGSTPLTKVGANTVTLAGANTYTGSTIVEVGTLSLASATLDNASTVSIATDAHLNLTHGAVDDVAVLLLNGVPQPDGTYPATLSGPITGSGSIRVITPAGYSTWASANANNQTADLDFDNDGVKNGVEYFMGQTGSSFTANPSVVGGTVTWTNGGNIPSGDYGTQFVVQTSSNLVTWTPVLAGSLTTNTSGPGGSLTYTLPTGAGKIFARLVVTPN
ncbi:MAG: autotransporter-associated beta strand repeat-containing protein [Verrucomicrobiota bacterium]